MPRAAARSGPVGHGDVTPLARSGALRRLTVVVAIAYLLPAVGIFVVDRLFGPALFVDETAHLAFELVGSCVALAVAGLLTMRARMDPHAYALVWVAASLAAMGTTDAVHALLPVGIAWSWLRHLATLEGGVLLALVWLPALPSLVRRNRALPLLIGLAALLLALMAWTTETALPMPWLDGEYTWGSRMVNAVGGIGFLVGGAWFGRRWLEDEHEDDLALTAYAALFGSAGLVFGFTWVWAPGWWWLHACRLLAYAFVMVTTWRMAGRSFEGLTASAQDLERRVAARTRERAESEARLTAIADNSPVAIAYLDTDLVVRFANPALEAWLALPPDRILGRPISEVIGPAAFAQRKDQLREALAGYRVRFEGAPPNASIGLRHSDSRYIPDIDEEGRVRGIYVFLIDVTELKEAQLALADAQETLRDHADALEVLVAERTSTLREAVEELEGFSYSIAHDMRAPLRAMQGYAQLLGQQNALDDRGREFVARIQASAERMDQLIRDVLDYSRVVRQELPVMTVAPEPLVREIIASYPQLHAPGVTVDVVGPMPSVRANPAALTQVFSNLLGNAVKFVAPGVKPSVVVRSEERSDATGRWIRFWVEDNGIGMAPEDTARIFEMFHRLRSAGAYAGTGMGLAIVRKAIERMDGRVGVESEPGRGSRFWFELRAPR